MTTSTKHGIFRSVFGSFLALNGFCLLSPFLPKELTLLDTIRLVFGAYILLMGSDLTHEGWPLKNISEWMRKLGQKCALATVAHFHKKEERS